MHCTSFIHQCLYNFLFRPGLFSSFVIFFTQTVGLLGWVISPSQGRYLHTGWHKHRINVHTDIHALSWIRTHDPSVQASEECLRPRGHSDWLVQYIWTGFLSNIRTNSKLKVFKSELKNGRTNICMYRCKQIHGNGSERPYWQRNWTLGPHDDKFQGLLNVDRFVVPYSIVHPFTNHLTLETDETKLIW
jgi:hypothetical protein